MRVFLSGGTGFIGRPLTRALLRRGWQVTALVRRPESDEAQAMAADGASLTRGDVTDRASVAAAIDGAEIVVHNAGWYELGLTAEAGRRMQAINVDGSANVLGLAAAHGARRIVHVSSVVALGDTGGALADETFQRQAAPTSAYEFTKTQAHAIAERLKAQGAPLITVCPAAVIGLDDHSPWGYAARLWVRGLFPPLFWAADRTHAFVHVEDVAEGIALAAERGRAGGTYILSAGNLRVRDLVALMETTPGGQRVAGYLPRPLALAVAGAVEPLLRAAGLPAFVSRETIANSSVDLRYSGGLAERELGWRPRDVEQAWREVLAAERAKT